ncbi:fimbrial assembly protein [Cellulomonas olei]|uniref:fimbrial assembly protein n=1 Tax=Cellulomonas sp. P4 TaxID=3142533 RepID=UPI0031BA8040
MSTIAPDRKKEKRQAPALAPLPQVNLLPPEVRAARGLSRTKRMLGLLLVLVLVLLAGAYAFALIGRAAADEELADAQAQTAHWQAEAAKYSEVPVVLDALQSLDDARSVAMSTDVEWRPYLDAIATVLPEGATIQTLTVTMSSPMEGATAVADPLAGVSLGQLAFSTSVPSVPDTAAWIDALNGIPGFADAWVSSAQSADEDGTVRYTVESTVNVSISALSARFLVTDGEEG